MFGLGNAPAIASFANSRDNNFNLIRMSAAFAVLISHAYPISGGISSPQPLEMHLNGITLGTLSVMVFFAISGFLITRSFDRSSSLNRFVASRLLRIFPALFVVLVVTVLFASIWTPLLSEPGAALIGLEYIARNMSLYFVQYPLPGVFEDNVYGPAINGSLWTLNHEFSCYVGVAIIGVAGFLRSKTIMAVCLLAFFVVSVLSEIYATHPRIENLLFLATPFAVGVAFYIWRSQIILSVWMACLLTLLPIVASGTALFTLAFSIALSYWVFVIAYLPKGRLLAYNRIGDYSYGVYIYAFPIQQLAVATLGPMSPIENMLVATPATLFCAVASWHLVEEPALSIVRRTPVSKTT